MSDDQSPIEESEPTDNVDPSQDGPPTCEAKAPAALLDAATIAARRDSTRRIRAFHGHIAFATLHASHRR